MTPPALPLAFSEPSEAAAAAFRVCGYDVTFRFLNGVGFRLVGVTPEGGPVTARTRAAMLDHCRAGRVRRLK